MTDENAKLFEELTQDRLEDALRLDIDNEVGLKAFDEAMKLMDRQIEMAKFEASVQESKAKVAAEKRTMVVDVAKWAVGLTVATYAAPKIQNFFNKDLAQTFAALEKEDFYNMTPYKSLKGLFRFK